jgi:hypothetical protein
VFAVYCDAPGYPRLHIPGNRRIDVDGTAIESETARAGRGVEGGQVVLFVQYCYAPAVMRSQPTMVTRRMPPRIRTVSPTA